MRKVSLLEVHCTTVVSLARPLPPLDLDASLSKWRGGSCLGSETSTTGLHNLHTQSVIIGYEVNGRSCTVECRADVCEV